MFNCNITIYKALLLFYFAVLQCCNFSVYSQNKRIPFEHIGITEGLSESNIMTIVQDDMGFMWFGSWDGLNKYDGYKITVFKNISGDSTSISNNYINKISKDKKGNLWIATEDGLNYFDLNKEIFKRYKHNNSNLNSICNNIITTVLTDREGKVWIGTQGGLDCYDPVKDKFTHLSTLPDVKSLPSGCGIKNIYEDRQGNLWFCNLNENGVSLLKRNSNSFINFRNSSNINSLAGNNVNTIFEDSKGRIWLGTNGNGIDIYDVQTNTFRHFKHDDKNQNSIPKNVILAINEDDLHNLWISTENGGISIFNYSSGMFTTYQHDEIDKESISNNSAYCIYKDNKGNIWLGNFAGWVDMAMSDKLLFTHFKHTMNINSLSNNQVLSIMEDSKKKLWIGTDGGGVDLFDPITREFKHFRHQTGNVNSISGDNVLNTMEDSKGNIWVGTWTAGITVLNAQHKVIKHFKLDPSNPSSLSSNNAWKIFEDRDKHIWIGTYGGGLNLLNPDGRTFTRFTHNDKDSYSIAVENVVNIYEDKEGQLWLSSESNGLDMLDKKRQRFIHFLHSETSNSISNNNVNSVFEDSDNNLWIGTMHGLNLYNKKTGIFTLFTKANGLAGDYVFGILEDGKKTLWISTNNGISRFNPVNRTFENYSTSDGIQSKEFKLLAVCKSSSGTMYFGGINGFNEFLPENIKRKSFDPPLVITGFSVFNKKLPIEIGDHNPSPLKQSISKTASITLPYSSTVMSFEFASLNYTGNERKHYWYKLEGFDNDWTDAGMSRTATYTNLNPGTYTFKVKGLNNEGEFTSHLATIQLIITPPYWLTWWFKLCMFVLFFGSVYAAYRLRVRSIKRQKVELQHQVDLQTHQLQISAAEERKARQEAEDAHLSLQMVNAELEKSEQRYSTLFFESPWPKWLYDIETLKFIQVNNAAISHYGFSKEEFLNMTVTELNQGHTPKKENGNTDETSFKINYAYSGRYQHLKKSKEIMEVEIHSNVININDKEYGLLLAVDITEKIRFENRISKAIIKTQDDERYEIGSELHDNIGQILVCSQMNISMMEKNVSTPLKPFYEKSRMYITKALDEIRNLSHRLAPVFFDESTLEDAFTALTNSINIGGKYEISINFYRSVKKELLNRDLQLNLYRILQEQLRNIIKHANATYISIDVMLNNNTLIMITSDDGNGFNLAAKKDGIGIANMKRRAELFSGTIDIDTQPGKGCSFTVTIPLDSI